MTVNSKKKVAKLFCVVEGKNIFRGTTWLIDVDTAITAAHCLIPSCNEYLIIYPNGFQFTAKVIDGGNNSLHDVALLNVSSGNIDVSNLVIPISKRVPATNDEVIIFGFPSINVAELVEGLPVKCSLLDAEQMINRSGHNILVYLLNAESVVPDGKTSNLQGMSGSPFFWSQEDEYALGVFTQELVVGNYYCGSPISSAANILPALNKCLGGSKYPSTYEISGRVFGPQGHPVADAHVVFLANNERASAKSDATGGFKIYSKAMSSKICLVAKCDAVTKLSKILIVDWKEAKSRPLNMNLKSEWQISGCVKWCGSEKPVSGASVEVIIVEGETRNLVTDADGKFATTVPEIGMYSINITADDAVDSSNIIYFQDIKEPFNIYMARKCNEYIHHGKLVETLCDDVEISFSFIPSSNFFCGHPDAFQEKFVEEIYIACYPITCRQYSFYLQKNALKPIPKDWVNRCPPFGKENHPVTGISWDTANEFCEWLSSMTGIVFRLPNADEWEKASKGNVDARKYPWGNEDSKQKILCNIGADKNFGTTPVDKYSSGRSLYGVWDMVGNVWEWTSTVKEDIDGDRKYVVKGGSYLESFDIVNCYSCGCFTETWSSDQIGFRVAREKGELTCRYL